MDHYKAALKMRIMIISMSMMTTMIIVILIMRMMKMRRIVILMRRMTMNFRSWDAVKGVALDQKTDHADYVQV